MLSYENEVLVFYDKIFNIIGCLSLLFEHKGVCKYWVTNAWLCLQTWKKTSSNESYISTLYEKTFNSKGCLTCYTLWSFHLFEYKGVSLDLPLWEEVWTNIDSNAGNYLSLYFIGSHLIAKANLIRNYFFLMVSGNVPDELMKVILEWKTCLQIKAVYCHDFDYMFLSIHYHIV